jgi:hypothetical protein
MSDINCCPKCGNEDIDIKNIETIESESIKKPIVQIMVNALGGIIMIIAIIIYVPEIIINSRKLLQAWSNAEIIRSWTNAELILRIILVMIYSLMGLGIGAIILLFLKYSIKIYTFLHTKIRIILIRNNYPENKFVCKHCWHSWNNY